MDLGPFQAFGSESLLGCAQLGAEVADAPSEAMTHVVAARDRTDKVLWARQHARHAVSPLWLQSCGARACQLWPRLGAGSAEAYVCVAQSSTVDGALADWRPCHMRYSCFQAESSSIMRMLQRMRCHVC